MKGETNGKIKENKRAEKGMCEKIKEREEER